MKATSLTFTSADALKSAMEMVEIKHYVRELIKENAELKAANLELIAAFVKPKGKP